MIAKAHEVLEKEAGLGNVWSLESLRRWLQEAGDDRIETVQKFVGYPARASGAPLHRQGRATRAGDGAAARRRLQPHPSRGGEDRPMRSIRIRAANPEISDLGDGPAGHRRPQQRAHDRPAQRGLAAVRGLRRRAAGLAFRSVFVAVVSLLPGLFPVVASGRDPVGARGRAGVRLRRGAAGGVRPRHRCAHPLLQPLALEERKEPRAGASPSAAPACWWGRPSS